MQYIWFLSILFAIHYLADFFVQVYTWKSNNQWVRNLITHTITYIFVLIFGVIVLEAVFPALTIPSHALLGFIAINSVMHFIVDLCTKLLTRTLRKHNELTAYVNVIALDQCIHYITLLITFGFFFIK
jgi:hypothetical protein